MRDFILGIDTSNYTTSAALVSLDGSIVKDERKLLDVKRGERGLRQQEALFQHIRNMPAIFGGIFDGPDTLGRIAAVTVSVRPRPVEGSYMPVFTAGESYAESLAVALGVPLYRFSHQEGHIAAAAHGTKLENADRFIMFHLSGGTTEAVLCEAQGDGRSYTIIGGTKDISFGQLIDRTGVALGYGFPAGRELDALAYAASESDRESVKLPKIKVTDGYINLSGIETAVLREIENSASAGQVAKALFDRTADAITKMALDLSVMYGTESVLLAGGVSASRYIRDKISETAPFIVFGDPALSSDNAVGTALLGRMKYGIETDKSQ